MLKVTQLSAPNGPWKRIIMMGVRGLTARAGDTIHFHITLHLPRFKCVCVCECVWGGCWGEGSVIPHTAVLSPPSPFPSLPAELELLSLKLSFWGRGREPHRFPRSSLLLGAAPLTLSQPGSTKESWVECDAVGPPLAGDWLVGGWGRSLGRGPPLARYPPPPKSGAQGKVSASARDSPWPLPSARVAESPRSLGRLLSRDLVSLTPSNPKAQGQDRRGARTDCVPPAAR